MKKTAIKLFIILFILINLPFFAMSIFQKNMEIKHQAIEQDFMLEKIKNDFQRHANNYLFQQEENFQQSDKIISKKTNSQQESPNFEIINNRLVDVFTTDEKGKIYKIKKESKFLDGLFMPAPVVIEVSDLNSAEDFPIAVINAPPFEYFSDKYSSIEYGNVLFKIIPITEPERYNPSTLVLNLSVLIVSIIICWLLTNFLNKNYIYPLKNIKNLLTEVKKGNLNIKIFNNEKEKAVYDLYYTLNDVVNELKEKKSLQDFYIQGLAHDLRAPALAQDRALSILDTQFKDNELVTALKNNQETYINFINLILEAYNTQQQQINKQKIVLKGIVKNIEIIVQTLLKEKNITIKTDFCEEFWLYADYTAITRVLMNLISNAIEHLDNDKTITIRGFYENDKTIVIVEDNGYGIEPDFIKYIFEKNSSLHKTGQKAVRGLGLSICKDLMEKQNGKISVESEVDKYTRFILEIENETIL